MWMKGLENLKGKRIGIIDKKRQWSAEWKYVAGCELADFHFIRDISVFISHF